MEKGQKKVNLPRNLVAFSGLVKLAHCFEHQMELGFCLEVQKRSIQ